MRCLLFLALTIGVKGQVISGGALAGGSLGQSAAVYYVDPAGNDACNGLSSALGSSGNCAWATAAKVASTTLAAGQTVGFKSAGLWRETLTINQSGSSGKPITVVTYGGTTRAEFRGSDLITSWTLYSGNAWQATVTTQPTYVFFNGTLGILVASAAAVTAQYDWFWSSNTLYVYSPSGSPNSYYTTPGVESGSRARAVYLNGQDYVTLSSVLLTQAQNQDLIEGTADHISFSNCRMGYLQFIGTYFGDPSVRQSTEYGLFQVLDSPDLPLAQQAALTPAVGGVISRSSVRWDAIEATQGTRIWTAVDSLISTNQSLGVETLLALFGSPQWANGSSNYQDVPTGAAFTTWVSNYVNFAQAVATRYHSSVKKWELWNEPNLYYFWNNPNPNVANYVTWASAVYSAMKAIDPTLQLTLQSGSEGSGNGTSIIAGVASWIPAVYAAGLYADGLSIHPYEVNGTSTPPPNQDSGQDNFTDIAGARAAMVTAGRSGDLLWATEWGWPNVLLTDAVQASDIVLALEMLKDLYPYVSVATESYDIDRSYLTSPYKYFGLYASNGTTKKQAARAVYEFEAFWK